MKSHDPAEIPLIGSAPSFQAVLEHISLVAPLDRPVLVIGERGTGKELIAARLHYLSPRWDRPFVKLNCAALAESLLETELFGHEAGSFTGATKRQLGRFELAHEGTLFLDELATTSPRVQEKILRVIEYGEFERVGGRETIRVNVRLIGATNVDLPAEARAGRFREDLLDRLAFDVITLPPLRSRLDDIMPLAEHYATRMSQDLRRELFPGFSQEAKRQLLDYPWPGNVRELRNVVERAVYRHQDMERPIEDIVFDPFRSPYRPFSATERPPITPSPAVSAASADPACPPLATPPAMSADARPGSPPRRLPIDLVKASEAFEVEWLETALAQAKYNQRRAAELLGLSYHQLRGYLRKYKLVGGDSKD